MTTIELHAAHWRYVRRLLPRYGVPTGDVEDVAQAVWATVHQRIDTYDPAVHRSWRAWITGIARRCAANHRRAEAGTGAPSTPPELLPAPGLDAEQAAILWDMLQSLLNDDQREALLLQLEGLSVIEIAAIQDVTPDAVERRLRMAKDRLKGDDDRRAGAFLGFGSFEALADALRPRDDLPDEVGEREWERIAEAIRRLDGAPAQDAPPPSSPPPPAPPRPARPAASTQASPGIFVIGKGTLVGLLAAAFLGGAGAGGALAWQDRRAPAPLIVAAPFVLAATAPSSSGGRIAASGVPSSLAATTALPSSSTAAATAPPLSGQATAASTELNTPSRSAAVNHIPSSSVPSAAPRVPAAPAGSAAQSMLLLVQADRAVERKQYAKAIEITDEHARLFGALDKDLRDAVRGEASQRLRRAAEHQQIAGPPSR